MKNTYPSLTKKIFSFSPDSLAISSVTVFELEYGAEKSNWGEQNRNNLKMFLSPFTILSFNNQDAIFAGRIRGCLEKKGTPIGPYDVQIAAQAVSRNLTLVTHNTKEFMRVPNLIFTDWVS